MDGMVMSDRTTRFLRGTWSSTAVNLTLDQFLPSIEVFETVKDNGRDLSVS